MAGSGFGKGVLPDKALHLSPRASSKCAHTYLGVVPAVRGLSSGLFSSSGAIQRTQVRRLLSGEPLSPQPITKGQGLLSKGQSVVGKGQDIVGSLTSGATAGLLSSAAPRSMAAAVTRTTSVLRRSASDDLFR